MNMRAWMASVLVAGLAAGSWAAEAEQFKLEGNPIFRDAFTAELKVSFTVEGAGELAGQASGSPNKPASHQIPECTTFKGRCIAILRPKGSAGAITLKAEAEGLERAQILVQTTDGSAMP